MEACRMKPLMRPVQLAKQSSEREWNQSMRLLPRQTSLAPRQP
jgi:hypothetical protein